MNLMNILLQSQAQNSTQGKGWENFAMIAVILLIFYFFMIRPQMKRSKEQKKFREGLQKGQKVVTIGGIHGKITEVGDATVTIEVENGAHLKMEKSAIASSIGDQLPDNK